MIPDITRSASSRKPQEIPYREPSQVASQYYLLPGGPPKPVGSHKRKRIMDEDDIDNYSVELGRGGRTKDASTGERPESLGSAKGTRSKASTTPSSRQNPKDTMRIAPSPILDGVDEAECGVLGNILLGRGQTRNVTDLTPLPVIQSGEILRSLTSSPPIDLLSHSCLSGTAFNCFAAPPHHTTFPFLFL
jgi:hypothetical protein